MYDPAIHYPGRPPAPVEVTADLADDTVAALNALDKRAGDRGALPTRLLGRPWTLYTRSAPNVKRLTVEAEPHLQTLERLDIDRVDRYSVRSWLIQHRHTGAIRPWTLS
jgi:hypothetical protein